MSPIDWIKASRRRKLRASQIAHHQILNVKSAMTPPRDGLVAFSRARDELLRLPYFLDHYRKLGICRFVIVDNGSRDGSLEYLVDQKDVDVFTTASAYGESSSGLAWIERLIQSYGIARWVLIADIDELLVYDDWQRRDLNRVASLLDRQGSHALKATMVDMYSGPGAASTGAPLWEQYPWLDGTSYRNKRLHGGGTEILGGPRERVLSTARKSFGNSLTKYPFFRWSRKWAHTSIHLLKPTPNPDIPRAALLHFKFMDDFATRAEDLQLTSGYHGGGKDYQRYRELLANGPLDLFYEGSVAYRGVETLIEKRLMQRLGLTAEEHSA